MRENVTKRGPFLTFLYITVYRFLQKEEHMVKSPSFLLQKEECPSKRGTVGKYANEVVLLLIISFLLQYTNNYSSIL